MSGSLHCDRDVRADATNGNILAAPTGELSATRAGSGAVEACRSCSEGVSRVASRCGSTEDFRKVWFGSVGQNVFEHKDTKTQRHREVLTTHELGSVRHNFQTCDGNVAH